MRIRFRASEFGQVAKINVIRANRNRGLVRRLRSGHLFFSSCDSAVRFSNSENSCQCRLLPSAMSGAAPGALRSALDSSIQARAQ